MTKLESIVNAVLELQKRKLALSTWECRRQTLNQMLKLANSLGIAEPCSDLYAAFIADDHGSLERRASHVHCVRMVDAMADTRFKDEHGILFNEPLMPCETETREFFHGRDFPISADVCIDLLIVKAEIEMRHLQLTASTVGQYKHSWMNIRRYFYNAGVREYNEAMLNRFIREIKVQRDMGFTKEWKWKIDRKAACVLLEVAHTGRFNWGMVNRGGTCSNSKLEPIRLLYHDFLKQRNLSKSTICLHNYVLQKTLEFAAVETPEDLSSLDPTVIQLVIQRFADICTRRSMATILPVLRSLLVYFHTAGFVKTDLSGIVMGAFNHRGSVAAYISEADQKKLITRLGQESKRTKAIILLVLKLGLRDSDICNLTFQAIDLHRDKIKLAQKKTGEPLVLPLLPDVGNALMDYICNERPKRIDKYPYIFLRKQAPYNKLSSVYMICMKLLKRHKIQPVNGTAKGAHLFRYSMVHRLLAAKVPRRVITDALGHASKESDKPYISMEESMLRMCALDLSVIGRVSWRGGTCDD